jgi:hypothetical protein
MRPPGLRTPASARHRKRSAAVPALRFAPYHPAPPSHSFALCHNFVCRASFWVIKEPFRCQNLGWSVTNRSHLGCKAHCPAMCPAKKSMFFGHEIRVGKREILNITPIDVESCAGSDLAGALGVGYSLAATRPKDQWFFFPCDIFGKISHRRFDRQSRQFVPSLGVHPLGHPLLS